MAGWWQRLRGGGRSDAFGVPISAEPAPKGPTASEEAEHGSPSGPSTDWTTAPAEQVAPWRQADRARVEAARASQATGGDADAGRLAIDIHRLTDLHRDGALTDRELVDALRTLLT